MLSNQLSIKSFALVLEYYLDQVVQSPDYDSKIYDMNLLEFEQH